jgi:saccharopine dehydrogenase (NAD+, L-lysine forming)
MRRVLVVGTGGVGAAIAMIARHRDFFERMMLADVDPKRAAAAAARTGDARFASAALDASDADAIVALARSERADVIVNACDPRLNPAIFAAALRAGVPYLDMAMTLSRPHPERPHELPGVMLGDEQFAFEQRWREPGLLALVGMGVEPGVSDVFARHAADDLFSEIDEVGVRDGADLVITGYHFAPTFSIWTTIEECLNPPLIWEADKGFFTTAPFSQPERFEFPAGIGTVECVNVEHEEVVLIPRWVDCRRVTFKYGLGTGRDGAPRAVYLHHVVDNAETMARDESQAVVWQTALHPVVALELLAADAWSGAGVLGPEAFPARPFLDALADYGSPHALDERDPANPLATGGRP